MFDFVDLKDRRPELGVGVRVVDLNQSELLEHPSVQLHLLLLESRQHCLPNVARKQVRQFLQLTDLTLQVVHLCRHRAVVRTRLKQRRRCRLTRCYVLNVLLCLSLLSLCCSHLNENIKASGDYLIEGSQIVAFSFNPVVEVDIRVAQ